MLRLSLIDSHSLPSFNSGRGKTRQVAKQAYEYLSDVAFSFPQSTFPSPPSQSLLFCLPNYHFRDLQTIPQKPSQKSFFLPSKRFLPSFSSKPIPKNHSFSFKTNEFSSLPSLSVSSPSSRIFYFLQIQ
uniref:Uncharacterized protein n=1 Tax=Gossypium raimondii TaxID=29730 RepID=A0A0D2S1Z6_GOSRA|nr:hypothetical protein B456_009G157500 [Gossypium raimondii]